MLNSGRLIVLLLVGVVTVGCEDKEPVTPKPQPIQSSPTTAASPEVSHPTQTPSGGELALAWAEVLEQDPDPRVVTDPNILRRIAETELPWRVRDKVSGIELLLVPAGQFGMDRNRWDRRSHAYAQKVNITKPFYLGRTEVTQVQWMNVMRKNPSEFQTNSNAERARVIAQFVENGLTADDAQVKVDPELSNQLLTATSPVDSVSWDDCQKFCVNTGLKLPTEAQWGAACLAGGNKLMYGQRDEIAWFKLNSGGITHPVAQKAPNALGFYDMLGNVWEWCEDGFEGYAPTARPDPSLPVSGMVRVVRGGAWYISVDPHEFRFSLAPDTTYNSVGFRVARAP